MKVIHLLILDFSVCAGGDRDLLELASATGAGGYHFSSSLNLAGLTLSINLANTVRPTLAFP